MLKCSSRLTVVWCLFIYLTCFGQIAHAKEGLLRQRRAQHAVRLAIPLGDGIAGEDVALALGVQAAEPSPVNSWGTGQANETFSVGIHDKHGRPQAEENSITLRVSALMIANVACVIALLYLIKSEDEDIRYYALRTIDLGISLFTALVLFSAVHRCITEYLTGGSQPPIWVQVLHMLIWFVIMQTLAATLSGAVSFLSKELAPPDPDRHDDSMVEIREEWRRRRLQVKCWAGLTTHLTAIAGMTALGSLQEVPFFARSPLTSLLVVPIGFVSTLLLYQGVERVRYHVAMADDGLVDFAEAMWDEEAKHGENEVISLSLSFVTLQAYGFWLVGRGPMSLSSAEGISVRTGTWQEILGLVIFAGLCIGLTIPFARLYEALKRRWHIADGNDNVILRCVGIGVNYFMMCLAWSMLTAIKEGTAIIFPTLAKDGIVLKIAVALTTTFLTFGVILVLDKIADMHVAGGQTERIIVTIINANSFLIGFSWEVCFSKALVAIGGPRGNVSGITHLALSIMVCVVVIPAYRWYLLPERHGEGQELAKMRKGISVLCGEEVDNVTSEFPATRSGNFAKNHGRSKLDIVAESLDS
mmetsp:Transcript_68956/g.128766  ORF Transcript_68956/g.128766 Transcript_68956/m.128766 type:complete len:586 (+) Transcript_68956:114-1871(+)